MIEYIEEYKVDKTFFKKSSDKIKKEISEIKKNLNKKYDSDYASFYLPKDNSNIKKIKSLAKNYSKYDTIVVIGIGGSNLGTIAVLESLYGKNYNLNSNKKIFFSDTVDSFSMAEILNNLKKDILDKKKILINVISKSGTTTETISNFQVLFNFLKKNKINLNESIVITTDKKSKLWVFGEENKLPLLEIPKKVGGRFSVLSSVGLFPLATFGVNIDKLVLGAKEFSEICMSLTKNPALNSCTQIAYAKKNKINIYETFIFEPRLESLGKWYRQLMGESLGKQYSLDGKEVWEGMTPTVAVGSVDLHSMAQLYLGGPWDKYVCFILPQDSKKIKISSNKKFNSLLPSIQNKNLNEVMDSIIKGVQKAFLKQGRPFCTFTLNPDNPYDLGAILQIKMFEIVFLAKLFNVNPFDQPNVEEYKIITKKELSKK